MGCVKCRARFGMARAGLLSLAAAGAALAGGYALLQPDISDLPAKVSEAEIEQTPWTKIDTAAQGSPHAIVPEGFATAEAPAASSGESAIREASATPATEQVEHVKVISPASIREGPSASTAILGLAQSGASAQVISRQEEWVQIIDPDSKKTGWIQSSMLETHDEPGLPAMSGEEIDAALARADEIESPSESVQPSVKPRKSKSHAGRSSHRKRGFALRRLFRRAW
jgi:SH3-like domain-containing protein